MIFTSDYTNLTARTPGSGKSDFFAPGEAAQKKTIYGGACPVFAGEWLEFFPLFPLAHAPIGTLPSFSGMAHSATVCGGHHLTTGAPQTAQRRAAWAASSRGSLRPCGTQTHNMLKLLKKTNYGTNGQQCTKARNLR